MDKGKVKIYLSNIKDVDAREVFERFSFEMTKERLDRIEKVKNETAKKSIICTGALLAEVLNKYSVYKNMIVSSSCGKPYIIGRGDICFNVSNSGDYVVVAIADSEVGIDIQKPVIANESLIKRVMSQEDIERFGTKLNENFSYIWATKEAYVKYTGTGIARELGEISFPDFNSQTDIYDNGVLSAKCQRMIFEDGYSMATVLKNDFCVELISIDLGKR